MMHWLSFADGERSEGQQFLGACVVEAPSFLLAVFRTYELGINPGGEVMGIEIPPECEDKFRAHLNKLMGIQEWEAATGDPCVLASSIETEGVESS